MKKNKYDPNLEFRLAKGDQSELHSYDDSHLFNVTDSISFSDISFSESQPVLIADTEQGADQAVLINNYSDSPLVFDLECTGCGGHCSIHLHAQQQFTLSDLACPHCTGLYPWNVTDVST